MTDTSAVPDSGTGTWPQAVAAAREQPFPWWSLFLTGLLGVLFGAAVLIWPDLSLRIMAALAGIWLFLAGIARLIGSVLPRGGGIGRHILDAVVGLMLLVVGLVCLRNLVTRLAVLALLFSITWVLSGITIVAMATQATGTNRILLLIVGALTLIAGLVFAFAPNLSLTTLIILTGVSSLVVGAGEVILALALRRTQA